MIHREQEKMIELQMKVAEFSRKNAHTRDGVVYQEDIDRIITKSSKEGQETCGTLCGEDAQELKEDSKPDIVPEEGGEEEAEEDEDLQEDDGTTNMRIRLLARIFRGAPGGETGTEARAFWGHLQKMTRMEKVGNQVVEGEEDDGEFDGFMRYRESGMVGVTWASGVTQPNYKRRKCEMSPKRYDHWRVRHQVNGKQKMKKIFVKQYRKYFPDTHTGYELAVATALDKAKGMLIR